MSEKTYSAGSKNFKKAREQDPGDTESVRKDSPPQLSVEGLFRGVLAGIGGVLGAGEVGHRSFQENLARKADSDERLNAYLESSTEATAQFFEELAHLPWDVLAEIRRQEGRDPSAGSDPDDLCEWIMKMTVSGLNRASSLRYPDRRKPEA